MEVDWKMAKRKDWDSWFAVTTDYTNWLARVPSADYGCSIPARTPSE